MLSFTLRALQTARKRDFEELSEELRNVASDDSSGKKSISIIDDFLEDEGFHLTHYDDALGGAFTAEWGEGSPVIGYIAEFNSHPEKEEWMDFSGSGRDLQTSAVMEAAVLTAEYLKRNDSEGTVLIYFCPSSGEETEKTLMMDEGLFDTADIAISWQPYTESGIIGKSPAGARVRYEFESEPTALAFIDMARKISQNAQMRYNLSSSLLTLTLTGTSVKEVRNFLILLGRKAEEAARERNESVNTTLIKACPDFIKNETLDCVMYSNAELLFPLSYTRETSAPEGSKESSVSTTLKEDGITLSSPKDFASVSRVTASSSVAVACFGHGCVIDTRETGRLSGLEEARTGMHTAALIMAATSLDMLTNPMLLEKAKEEHRRKAEKEKLPFPYQAESSSFFSEESI